MPAARAKKAEARTSGPYSRSDEGDVRKGPWDPDEDNALREAIHRFGPGQWVQISNLVSSQVRHIRNAKQCRERWCQNLDPSINSVSLSEPEQIFVEAFVASRGTKWAECARLMNNRTDNNIKNWWNGQSQRARRERAQGRQQTAIAHSVAARQNAQLYHHQPAGQMGFLPQGRELHPYDAQRGHGYNSDPRDHQPLPHLYAPEPAARPSTYASAPAPSYSSTLHQPTPAASGYAEQLAPRLHTSILPPQFAPLPRHLGDRTLPPPPIQTSARPPPPPIQTGIRQSIEQPENSPVPSLIPDQTDDDTSCVGSPAKPLAPAASGSRPAAYDGQMSPAFVEPPTSAGGPSHLRYPSPEHRPRSDAERPKPPAAVNEPYPGSRPSSSASGPNAGAGIRLPPFSELCGQLGDFGRPRP